MIWHQPSGAELAARIAFGNLSYASHDEPRTEESFDFRVPVVQFDPGRTFFVRSGHGEIIPVARFRKRSGL